VLDMNERIKELDKQAKLWAIDNTNFPISSHIPAGYTEKFAELIIKETLNQVNETMELTWPAMQVKIKKHFGVKE